MKKLKILIGIIIIFFSFFLITYFKKRNYVINYKVKKYNITERYDKDNKSYYVSVKKGKDNYYFIIKNEYTRKRKLVDNIKLIKNENKKCLLIDFNKTKVNPSCTKDGEFISYYLLDDNMKNEIGKKYYNKYTDKKSKDYKNIDVNTLFNKKVLIWNYHGFYYLSKDKNKDITLFKNDTYDAPFIATLKNYVVIPNYNESYEYNKLIVLNINDFKTKNIKLNDPISSDSYVLGNNLDSVYIFDKKYEKEYEIVPHKLKYRTVSPFIYDKGKKVEKTALSLKNKNERFIYKFVYNYELINNKLYRTNIYNKNKELISNLDIKTIVKENNDEVYYVSGDKLYVNSVKYGEIELLEYFELNFNYDNIFYIFD